MFPPSLRPRFIYPTHTHIRYPTRTALQHCYGEEKGKTNMVRQAASGLIIADGVVLTQERKKRREALSSGRRGGRFEEGLGEGALGERVEGGGKGVCAALRRRKEVRGVEEGGRRLDGDACESGSRCFAERRRKDSVATARRRGEAAGTKRRRRESKGKSVQVSSVQRHSTAAHRHGNSRADEKKKVRSLMRTNADTVVTCAPPTCARSRILEGIARRAHS